jgi:hypothetical protein
MIVDLIAKLTISIVLFLYVIMAFIITILSFFFYDNPNSGGLYTNLLALSCILSLPIAIIAIIVINTFSININDYILSILIIYLHISIIHLFANLVLKFNKNGTFVPN